MIVTTRNTFKFCLMACFSRLLFLFLCYLGCIFNIVNIFLEELIADIVQTVQYQNIEPSWMTWKKKCIVNKNKKQTRWWNEQIKEQVKIKKRKWLAYLNKKDDFAYREYNKQKIIVKSLVKESKTKSWKEFGNKMENNHKKTPNNYEVLKNW